MHAALATLILAFWTAIHPQLARQGDAALVAPAIATAVLEDAEGAPVFGSHVEDAAVMAFFAYKESSLYNNAVGDGGRSFGIWQQQTACGRATVVEQARCWLRLLHEGAKKCPESPSAIAWGSCDWTFAQSGKTWTSSTAGAARVRRARELLQKIVSE